MVAKLTKEPKQRKKKNTEDNAKPPSPPSRSGIKQALRLKCNTLIHYETTKQQGISACCYTIDYFLRPQNDFFYRGSWFFLQRRLHFYYYHLIIIVIIIGYYCYYYFTELLALCDRCLGWVWWAGLMAGLRVGQAFGVFLLPGFGVCSSSPPTSGHPTSMCDSGINEVKYTY